MNENAAPLEIERKYLIRMPEETTLKKHSIRSIAITQTYLLPGAEGGNRRVRYSRWDGGEARYYTEKRRLSDITRIEREREIGESEYEELLKEADPARKPIEKVRWCVPFGGHTLEIDIFPFWSDRAYCEAEVSSEEESIAIPDWITVIREVTGDPRYTNHALSLEIPEEDI